jgi:hypothetical protein
MSQTDYDHIRRRITHRYNNRIGFFSHFVAFLVSNGFGWLLWLGTPENVRSGVLGVLLLLVSVGWLIGMSIHAIIYLMMEARERAIERAVQEERAWTSGEKPKRDPRVYLTEDGELEEIDDEDMDYEAAPKRNRR